MSEVWYVMDDGSVGDPHEVAPDGKGTLRHKDGRAVAMAPHGPRSRNVDAEAEREKAKRAKAKPAPESERRDVAAEEPKPHHRRDMQPEGSGRPYKTR